MNDNTEQSDPAALLEGQVWAPAGWDAQSATMKHIRPLALIAAIAFAKNRLPLRRTLGVMTR